METTHKALNTGRLNNGSIKIPDYKYNWDLNSKHLNSSLFIYFLFDHLPCSFVGVLSFQPQVAAAVYENPLWIVVTSILLSRYLVTMLAGVSGTVSRCGYERQCS